MEGARIAALGKFGGGDDLNCDHCHTPIESRAQLKIGIRPFKYLHYHNECYEKLGGEGQSRPLVLPEGAVQSLAISTLIPALVLFFMPLLADLLNGGSFDPVRAYSNNILIALLGLITLVLSLFHWRELGRLAKRN